jgi:hypothetical protein
MTDVFDLLGRAVSQCSLGDRRIDAHRSQGSRDEHRVAEADAFDRSCLATYRT